MFIVLSYDKVVKEFTQFIQQCRIASSSSSLLRGGLRPAPRPSINCGPMRNPDHNQRLGKSISRSYELERMHKLHRKNTSME